MGLYNIRLHWVNNDISPKSSEESKKIDLMVKIPPICGRGSLPHNEFPNILHYIVVANIFLMLILIIIILLRKYGDRGDGLDEN